MKKVNQNAFLFLFCFFLHSNVFAQITISGLLQNNNGSPIEFANVALTDTSQNLLIAGTISKEKGAFELKINKQGDFQLTVSYLGYKNWTKQVSTKTSTDLGIITLTEEINLLDDVVIVASRPVIERVEDKLLFNIASSTLNSGYDGMEVLQQAPYVWVDSEDNILMRNASPIVMVNGRPINLQGEQLANYIKNIPSDHIKSIEIQTTPGANTNADNLGGVINIILRKKLLGFNSTIRTHLESFGNLYFETYVGANLNYGAEYWNIYGAYNYLHRFNEAIIDSDISYLESQDYLKTKRTSESRRDVQNYQFGFVIAPHTNHEFGAEVFGRSTAHLASNIGELSFSNQMDILDTGTTHTSNDMIDQVNNLVLNYTWTMDTLNSTIKIIADGIRQGFRDDFVAKSNYDLMLFDDNEERNFYDNRTEILALQTDLIKNFRRGWKLGWGAKIGKTNRINDLLAERLMDKFWAETDESVALNYQEKITATYADLSKSFLNKHFIKAGLRLENTDLKSIDLKKNETIPQNYNNWFPSFHYAYDYSGNGSISTTYSRRLNRPAFTELNNSVAKANDFRYFIGNPDLQPEIIRLYELRLQHRKQSAALYYTASNNAINGVYDLIDGIAYYQRKNNGTQKQIGLEYNVSADLLKWWSFRAATNLYHRKFTNEAGVDRFKKSTISLRIFNNFKINKTTGIDLTFRYLSPTADAFYELEEIYYFNLLLKKSFLKDNLKSRIYIDDIFNTVVFSNTRPFSDIITTNSRKPRSRSIRLWFSYNLSNQNKVKNRKNRSENEARRRL